MDYTKVITTPVGGHQIVIKTLLSGLERENVMNASMDFVKTEDGKTFHVTDMKKVANAEKHALLKVSILSIDSDVTDCFERLQKMFETDYAFVYEEIFEAQKKMTTSTSAMS